MHYLSAVNWLGFAVFVALIMVIAMFGLSLSGHFPAEHQKPEMRAWHGRLLLVASIIAIAISAAQAFGLAFGQLPPAIAIIGLGGALLAAPLILQKIPDTIVNGRRGLIGFAALATALAWITNRL